MKRERPVVGKPCDVKLDIPDVDVEKDFDDLTGTLRRPGSNKEEPVQLSKNPDGTVGVTFTPYEPGMYILVPTWKGISVLHDSLHEINPVEG